MLKSILNEKLNELRTADASSINLLSGLFVPVTFFKSMSLPVPGQPFPALYFIEKGLVRGYFFYRQEEYTCWILEKGFLIPALMRSDDAEAMEYIQFLADTSGWSLDLNEAQLLAQKNPSLYRILLEIYRENIQEGKSRELMLRLGTANERLVYAEKMYGRPLDRVFHHLLASFLNIELRYLYKIFKKRRSR